MKYVGKNGLKVGDNEVWHEGNLEVGGRNLLLNSDFKKPTTQWVKYLNTDYGIEVINNGLLVNLKSGGDYRQGFSQNISPIFPSAVHVISVTVQIDDIDILWGGSYRYRVQWGSGNAHDFNECEYLGNSLYRFTLIITSPATSQILYIYRWNDKGYDTSYIVKNIKLERGTIATDWTPAPEDIQEQIDKKWEYDENTIKNVKVDKSKDADTVNGKTVAVNVPSDAKFTDTVTTINGKTGTITKADITALGIPAQDTVYTHPTSAGNKHIPAGGASGQFLRWSANGTATWDSVPGGLSLGETSGTAYRGDRGKVAYDHSQNAAVHIKTVTSATEPSNLNAGDQWHKEY